jgi:hypothetical protein
VYDTLDRVTGCKFERNYVCCSITYTPFWS